MEGENPYDLTKFGNIRDFSWIGPQSKEDFDAIRDCFVANARHLEALNLDLIDWSKADDFWQLDHTRFSSDPTRRKNFFAEDILGLSLDADAGSRGLRFPVLQSLFLGQLSFDSAISSLVSAFSFFQLKQLKLWNCPQLAHLLTHLTDSQQNLQLESLELTCGYEMDDYWEMEFAVPPFLQKVSGLTDLYLCLPILDWREVADSLCKHLATLERVVLHSRSWNIDHESPYFESEEDGELNFCNGFYELFTRGDCEIIGMRNSPAFLVSRLSR
jgi:hypothetical protein